MSVRPKKALLNPKLHRPNTWAATAREAILKTMDVGANGLDIEVIINKERRSTYPGYSIRISHSADFAITIAMKKLDYWML